MGTTETYTTTDTQLKRIAWLSARDPLKQFNCLMHHFNEESLAACFHALDGRKAVGMDGISKVRTANRRSQRKSFNWETFALYIRAHPLPKARICHALF